MRGRILAIVVMLIPFICGAQIKRVYDEKCDPMVQIDKAVEEASLSEKNVICQVGGNWCKWCLLFADFIEKNEDVSKVIGENYVYIHVNYPTDSSNQELSRRLGNPGRFGYPVLVVLDSEGQLVHIQDSSYLEEGKGYDPEKVLRFLNNWTPAALKIKT